MKNLENIFKELGSKIYRYDDNNNLELYRIIGFQNNEMMKVKNLNTKEISKVYIKSFLQKDGWYKIKPDGIIAFNIVTVGKDNIEDIIVALYRTIDIENAIKEPYAVCRQNITDLFFNFFKTGSNEDREYVGLSMSRQSCPIDFNFNIMTSCNGITLSIITNIYLEDSLDEILETIHTNPFDQSLNNLMKMHCNFLEKKYNISIDTNIRNDINGYCKNLYTLLELNRFMDDFNSAFNIEVVDCKIECDENGTIDINTKERLEYMMRKYIDFAAAIEYTRDIDIDRIKDSYVFLRDINDKLYLVVYTISDKEFNEAKGFITDAKNSIMDMISKNMTSKYQI